MRLPAWMLALALAAPGLAQWGGYAAPPYPDPVPWVWDVDRRGGVWAGVDHPWHQPTMPFADRPGPEARVRRQLLEGERLRRAGDRAGARRVLGEAAAEATRRWGEGSRLAAAARARLAALGGGDPPGAAGAAGQPPPAAPGGDPGISPATTPGVRRTLAAVRARLERARRARAGAAGPR